MPAWASFRDDGLDPFDAAALAASGEAVADDVVSGAVGVGIGLGAVASWAGGAATGDVAAVAGGVAAVVGGIAAVVGGVAAVAAGVAAAAGGVAGAVGAAALSTVAGAVVVPVVTVVLGSGAGVLSLAAALSDADVEAVPFECEPLRDALDFDGVAAATSFAGLRVLLAAALSGCDSFRAPGATAVCALAPVVVVVVVVEPGATVASATIGCS